MSQVCRRSPRTSHILQKVIISWDITWPWKPVHRFITQNYAFTECHPQLTNGFYTNGCSDGLFIVKWQKTLSTNHLSVLKLNVTWKRHECDSVASFKISCLKKKQSLVIYFFSNTDNSYFWHKYTCMRNLSNRWFFLT